LQSSREPIFNVPSVVVASLAVLALVHAGRALLLSPQQDIEFLELFAFIPARYAPGLFPGGGYPGGFGAEIWTFVTYSLIHADLTHLGMNAVWLLPFGTAVARRFGPLRYVGFFAATAACAALVHLATHSDNAPMVGASGAISGMMAAAMRFVFQRGAPLSFLREGDGNSYQRPAAPLGVALRDPRVLVFAGTWFGINLLLGLLSLPLFPGEQNVAWQAHIGGFLAGLLLFAVFDPVPQAPKVEQCTDTEPTRR
jgi:membrane associated rhomboid family serine protease